MAIKRPLDSKAVASADDRFYAKYPEMIDENGNRMPLGASDDPDNEMHEDWVRFYKEEAAKNEGGGGPAPTPEPDEAEEEEEEPETVPPPKKPPSDKFPTTPPDVAEDCPKSWISLDLIYAKDAEDCAGIKYSALTTAAYEQPTTLTSPKRWSDIPAGKCLFGEFEFQSKGKSAKKPDF